MSGKSTYCFILIVIMLAACTGAEDRLLKNAFQTAGKNKNELKKVFSHYLERKEDSLKLQAARFLIANMPLYYAVEHTNTEDVFKAIERLKSVQSEITAEERAGMCDSLLNVNQNPGNSVNFLPDHKHIKAGYLIHNIDYAFKAWNENRYLKDCSFEHFCEYVLPYKVRNEAPDYWRPILLQEMKNLYKSDSSLKDVKKLFDYHKENSYYEIEGDEKFASRIGHDMNFHQMDIAKVGECQDRCAYTIYHLRAAGVPATYDYIPTWGNRPFFLYIMVGLASSDKHMENLISNKNQPIDPTNDVSNARGKKMPHQFTKDELPWGLYVQYMKTVPKVYRQTWSAQEKKLEILSGTPQHEIYPSLCKPNMTDVTDEYLLSRDVSITVPEACQSYHLAYLAVFSIKGWEPAAMAVIDENNQAVFRDMGKNIVYLPVVYNGNRVIPFDHPFILDNDGKRQVLRVDREEPIRMRLIRKFPFFSYTALHAYWAKGSRIEGANKPDYSDAEVLHRVDYYPFYMNYAIPDTEKKYRYIRFCPEEGGKAHLAELEIYGIKDKDTLRLKGKMMGTQSDAANRAKAFDHDYVSYFRGYHKDEWVGLDLGTKRTITKLGFCVRNDGNCIIPGNEYELFYWDDQWHSLRTKTAEKHELNYKEVPANGLYWLKCHTEGKEERIFTYTREGQVWW